MKRIFFGEEGEIERIDIANLLMLLAHDSKGEINSRVFECKTCSRRFSSFQALGDHRASYKRPRLLEDSGVEEKLVVPAKTRVYECSIRGREFTVGQALRGHIKRHRAEVFHDCLAKEEKRLAERKRVPWLDLNLPPLEDGMDHCQKFHRVESELIDNRTPVVGCFL